MERIKVVKLNDAKAPGEASVMMSLQIAEHIRKCMEKNVPATNPKNGVPFDVAEIQYIFFQESACLSFPNPPCKEEIDKNWKLLTSKCSDKQVVDFLRVWLDIEHFVESPKQLSPGEPCGSFENYPSDLETSLNSNEEEQGSYSPPKVHSKDRKRKRDQQQSMSPSLERSCSHKQMEGEDAGAIVLRMSSLQKKKSPDCLDDFFVITRKLEDGNFKDDLVRECGRGWTITGAKFDTKNRSIVLDPVREFFPCFFDVLASYLSRFSLHFSNIRKNDIYNPKTLSLSSKKRKEK